jgi:hypothetical protein
VVTTVRVDLDLAVSGASAPSRLHVGYALVGPRVAALLVAGGAPVEGRVFDVAEWQAELERRLRVPMPAEAAPPPARVLELPWDLVVGTGEALAGQRYEVYDALVARDLGLLRADGAALDLPGAHEQLRRLHHSVLARLQAVVSGRHHGRGRIGWTSWLLFADGWRELTPYAGLSPFGGRRAMVRVEPRRPADLAARVSRWAATVRS